MTRVFLAAWSLMLLPLGSGADETTLRFNVSPKLAPTPAFKYQLLPELAELSPGNPAQNYVKCFMEQHTFFYSTQAVTDRARYQKMPLADLPTRELRHYGGNALRQADWAARLDTLDWEAIERVQKGGIEVLPGELGPLQVLASALNVRFRAEVAGNHFDETVRTAKTMLALSRHLGEHPTEVASRIGLWAANVTLGTVEEMVQQAGCPNLYWALTDLPDPLVDVRRGVQGQCTLAAAELRPVRDGAPMTEAEIETFVSRLSGLSSIAREQAGRAPRGVRTALQAIANDSEQVRAARRRLVECGGAQEMIDKFLPSHVILLDEKRDYEFARDERIKLLALPLGQIGSWARCEQREHVMRGVFAGLLPDVINLRLAQAQLQQRIALLRHIEALRLYAAEHDGRLPEKLRDFSVPLPTDPMTGKPFVYTREAATAHIRGGSIRIGDKGPGNNFHYEVTVQKGPKRRP